MESLFLKFRSSVSAVQIMREMKEEILKEIRQKITMEIREQIAEGMNEEILVSIYLMVMVIHFCKLAWHG